MKYILTIVIILFLQATFAHNNDSLQKVNLKKTLTETKFKAVKQKVDIPLEILKLVSIASYAEIDGEAIKFNWAQKSKNNIWILSFRLLSCGYYNAHYVIEDNVAKEIRYNMENSNFKEFKKWVLN